MRLPLTAKGQQASVVETPDLQCTIVLTQASTATSKRDYNVNAGTVSITGRTLQVG